MAMSPSLACTTGLLPEDPSMKTARLWLTGALATLTIVASAQPNPAAPTASSPTSGPGAGITSKPLTYQSALGGYVRAPASSPTPDKVWLDANRAVASDGMAGMDMSSMQAMKPTAPARAPSAASPASAPPAPHGGHDMNHMGH
jgi:hypothetical protein